MSETAMRDTANGNPLLAVRAVTKVYDRDGAAVRALDGVDLAVDAGEYIALLGPSGSGKSTLMHVLGCLDRPTAGSYRLGGEETGALSMEQLAVRRRGIGFVFQSFHLLPRQTAVQNVALPLRYAGVPPAARERAAADMLRRVGLGDRLQHRPNELSGGQQQRVAVARALVMAPRLLLCDEPTGNLDSRSGAEITALLEDLWREGRTLVVVTHDDRIAARARRVVRMLDGRIVADQRRADDG
jgi:putative ABC transport system ATP-binding protein